ncbi:NB-ARC domain-containing protein [[Phormidium] sp. ETS-05]|uniref:NB-ARC domain-containing protein n=1 Tax=[Phormidium] sp. ETS-05 TaxID=222819 RepID=UPI001E4DDF40|nr:NB-ARC domain-containing protein [[Phormidium] sp. ETS-05]
MITIYGLSGIGKSQLAVKLIPEIQTEFDYIIWRSLGNAPTFSTLQTQLKQFFSPSQPTPLPTIIDYFRSDRCLVILDDLQNIFKPGELAGQYLAGYEDYGKFFKQVATTPHQSCLILLSWEKPRDFTALSSQNRLLQAFHLQGIEPQAANFLQEKRLTDEARWSELITLYQGHPTWLNIIAAAIVELCNGSVTEFLSDTDNIFLGDLEPLLSSHLERLSELEIQVSHWLASENEAVDISTPPNPQRNLLPQPDAQEPNQILRLETPSKSDLWQAIQSLSRRGLVEKVALGAKVRFRINPVFQQYIRSKFG